MKDACSSCGEANASDAAFCASCGEYLGWDQRAPAVSTDAPPAEAQEPVAAPPVVARSPNQETTAERRSPVDGPAPGPAPAEASPTVPSRRTPAAPAQSSPEPAAATQPLPAVVRTPAEPAAPPTVDAPCPECTTVNGPDRRFCRRCGYQLVETPASSGAAVARKAARRPWWRRLFRSRAPGATPEARRAWRRSLPLRFRVLRAALVAVPLLLLAGLAVLAFPDPVGASRALWYDVIRPRVDPVTITPPAAVDPPAAAVEDWPAPNAVDGSSGTAWAARWTGEGSGEACEDGARTPVDAALVLSLEEEPLLRRVRVLPGMPADDSLEDVHRRPRVLELRTEVDCRVVELADEGTAQAIDLDALRAQSVRVAVMDVHGEPTPGDLVSISELQLFARPE